MTSIWKIILICITLCVICILIYNWWKNYSIEGFVTGTPDDVTLGTGWYNGTSQRTAYRGCTRATDPSCAEDPPTPASIIATDTIILMLSGGTLTHFKYNLPVEIYSGTTRVATGTLFSYSKPYVVIKGSSVSTAWTPPGASSATSMPWLIDGTGIKWKPQTTPAANAQCPADGTKCAIDTLYTIKAAYCYIEANKTDEVCITKPDDTLAAETEVEQNIYDIYEQYNIDATPLPIVTQHKQYDVASSLGDFDTNAPIPWDYDNNTLNPADVLWGNIHPNVSGSIFSCAYARESLQSINNLEYNETLGWTYKSLLFERTWSGDDKKFLPGIQTAEFIIETGSSIIVEHSYDRGEDYLSTDTKWGKAQTRIIEQSAESVRIQHLVYDALIRNNQWRAESKEYAQKYAVQHFENLRAMEKLSEADRNSCIAARDAIMGAEGSPERSVNNKILDKVITGNQAMYDRSTQLLEAKAASTITEPAIAARVAAANAAGTAVSSDARSVASRVVPGILKASGAEQRAITSNILRAAGAMAGKKLSQVTAGKLAAKLARAIGFTVAQEGLLWAAAAAWCGGTLGTTCPVLASAVTAITVFIDFFVISCCSYIPAILDAYIPADAVCPPGYFNIHDAMAKLPGGEIGWLIITSIPGFGDGLGTFGPYLCSKVVQVNGVNMLTDVALKTAPSTPGYFYDSTLSIFADTTKAVMRSDTPQFNDSRKYTRNASPPNSTPAWSDSGVPPIWVDFSDSRMLDKMAQFYYTYSRRVAEDNGDGTRTFEYITKIYGVIASSEFTCDIQCEITSLTFYTSTGTVQSRQIVPVDPTGGTTYHDRRFYFYSIQVPYQADIENAQPGSLVQQGPAYISASSIQSAYSAKLGYTFLTYSQRKAYVAGNNDAELNALMTDNINRYIVTACTHVDGTAPTALEVNGEGEYVGDALISLGDTNANYYEPEANINKSMLLALTNAYTSVSVDLGGTAANTSLKTFTYDNPLISFIMPYTDYDGTSFTGDTVQGIEIDNSNNPVDPSKKFTGTINNYIAGPPQTLEIRITENTITSGSKKYSISVTQRSPGTIPPRNDSNCSAMRNKFYKYGQTVSQSPTDHTFIAPTYIVTTPSTTARNWTPYSNSQRDSYHRTGFQTQKIWSQRYEGTVKSQDAISKQIAIGTTLGYIGFRVNYGMIPVGAILTGGVMNINFSPDWSFASLVACSYQDMVKSYGTYIMNGKILTIEEGIDNKYLYIERGPIIAFAPGYTPNINKNVIKLTQQDCINRNSIRRAVNTYNNQNRTRQVTKVLKIETDTTNSKCLYLFETVPYDSVKNLRNLTTSTNNGVVIPYIYSANDYALIQTSNLQNQFTLNDNGTYTPASGPGNFRLSIRDTTFSMSGNVWGQATKPDGAIEISPSLSGTISANISLRRTGNRDPDTNKIFTCATPDIQNRLVIQFNKKYQFNANISSINKSYAPRDGVNQNDGTYKCIYDVNIKTDDTSNPYPVVVTMTLTPANDNYMALYNLYSDNYPAAYMYKDVPKANQWIDITQPIVPETTIPLDSTCATLSTSCVDPKIISNLVEQFNKQMIDGKILKVRKGYTPRLNNSTVCDYEVEMLRTFTVGTSTNSIVQKESIRLPIVQSPTDRCRWNLNMAGSNIPVADTGDSLTNSASVSLLDTPYVWAPSILGNVQKTINGALLNYLNIDVAGILSNTTATVNREVTNVYETIATSQKLYHSDPTCDKRCKDVDVTQAIIDGYYTDNYPTSQYGAVQRKMTEVRRVGTYNSNTCQVEFVEKVETYKNFISSPIYSSDASNPDAKFNTRYYLRQYQFNVVSDPTGTCAYNMSSIKSLVSTGDFSAIDISNNAVAIMSDSSVIPSADLHLYSFSGKPIDCANPAIMNAVQNKYNESFTLAGTTKYNSLTAFSTAFNPKSDTCEYTVLTTRWFKSMAGSYYTLPNINVSVQAQWDSYNRRTGMNYTDSSMTRPSILREYDPVKITFRRDSSGIYQSYDALNNLVNLPYTFKLPVAYNTSRVSSIKYVCDTTGCHF